MPKKPPPKKSKGAYDTSVRAPGAKPTKGKRPVIVAPFDMTSESKSLLNPTRLVEPTELPNIGSAAHALVQFYGTESRIVGDIQKTLGVFNPRNVGTDIRLLMRQDPVIAFGLAILEAPIINLSYSIESKDPVIKAFVEWALQRVDKNMGLAASNAIPFGRQICDKIFEAIPLTLQVDNDVTGDETEKKFDQVWAFKRFKAIDPRTYHFLIDTAIDDWVGVQQLYMRFNQDWLAPVPREKLLFWCHRREKVFGRLEGMPILDQVYEPWWFCAATELIANRYFERKADPAMKIRSSQTIRVGGKDVDGFGYMANQALALKSGGVINLPNTKDKDGKSYLNEIDYLQDDKRGDQLQHRIDALQLNKLRGMWITDRAGTSGAGHSQGGARGGRAEASAHAELMAASQESMVSDYLKESIQPQVVDDLVRYNFGEEALADSKTRIVTSGISQSIQEIYKDTLLGLFQAEAAQQAGTKIRPWEYIEVPALLKALGVPLRSADELEELVDEREQQQADMQKQMQGGLGPDTAKSTDVNLGDPDLEKAVRSRMKGLIGKSKAIGSGQNGGPPA